MNEAPPVPESPVEDAHMLPISALKSMKVMFATPCYISGVTMNYVASMFSLALDASPLGLNCMLYMHSESLITRGRNKMVIKFLEDESLTHLFWIDSDIAFRSDSVFRLLRADRDIAAGVYPIKNFNWPHEGLPAGMTQRQFEDRYTQYPFNPIGHGAEGILMDPAGTRVFVSATPDDYVAVIDLKTLTVAGRIEAGKQPDGLAWSAAQ